VDFNERQRASRLAAGAPPKKTVRRGRAGTCRRDADRVDGFDRDDLGLSPDF
jgi:hypothetical protein